MGGFEGQGQTCELWSVGVCSLRGISFSYRFPFIREQEYVWAEILINPRSAADQSAAAPGLLSKGAAEFGHNPSLQAGGQDCLHPPLPPPALREGRKPGKPGPRQHPTGTLLTLPLPGANAPGSPIWDGAGWPRSIPRAVGHPQAERSPRGVFLECWEGAAWLGHPWGARLCQCPPSLASPALGASLSPGWACWRHGGEREVWGASEGEEQLRGLLY